MIIASEKDAQLIEFMLRSRMLSHGEVTAMRSWLNDTIGIDAGWVVRWLEAKA